MKMLQGILFLLMMLIVVLTHSVGSIETGDNEEVINEKNLPGKYKFNHPPSVDNYEPIPVAVVYDDGNGGISEQLKAEEDNNSSGKELKVDVINEYKANQKISHSPETTTIAARNASRKTKLRAKSRHLSELQIPVAVVYEDDSGADSVKVNETPKKSSHLRRRTNSNIPKKQIHKETAPLEKTAEKPVENIKARTFPKRLSGRDPVVPIVNSESYVFSHSGNFHYWYEGGDGTRAYSEGQLKKVDEGKGEAVKGGFSYTDKEGNDFSLSYTADENGYRPVGAHLPTPPPIPPAIARALQYLATATPEPVTKRSTKLGTKESDKE